MTAVSYAISDYHNDGHWLTDGTSFGYSVADVRLGGTSPYYETFLRFQLIDIDPGAIIEQAEITLTAVNAPPFATTVRIVGVAQADPPYPTSFADIQGRARTSASVEWTIPAHAENELLTSPNIASVLSELIAQSGWAAGNHILLVIEHVSANYVHRFGALGATTSHPSPTRLDIHFTGGGSGQPQSAVFSIGDYLDDGYSIQGGGINNNTTTGYLSQVPGGPHRRPYVRFATNGLAEGDAITAARLKLFPTSSRGPFAVAARVTGDRSAASPTPITSTSDYDSRARTSAFTDFELLTTTAGEPLGGPDGLDVTAIVAELVGDGHPEGAAIQFLIDITSVPGDNYHTISQASATNSASYPPMLEVEWTSSGGQPPGENPLPTVAIIQDYDARATWQPRVAVPGWPFPPAVSDPPSLDVRWQFWLDDGRGRRVALLDDVLSVDIVRAVNAPSRHAIELPGDFDLRLVKKDALIECWRTPVGHPLRLESVFFVRSVTHEANADGVDVLSVTGPDALDLLGRRIVAYPAASPQAAKTGPADDVMKAVVRENLGQLAIAGRSLSALGLMVDPDYGLGAVIEKRFAWRSVLSVLQDLAAASAEAGQPLDFALEPVARQTGRSVFAFWCAARRRRERARWRFSAASGAIWRTPGW